MNQGYTTLDQVVREACMESDDNALHNYAKFMLWATEGFQEMRIDTFQEIKSIRTETTTIATLPFPVDMVKWTKIGYISGDRLKVFTMNNRLIKSHEKECGIDKANAKYTPSYNSGLGGTGQTPNEDGAWFYGYSYEGSSGAIYGYGNGVQGDGQFSVNKDMREFQFNSDYASKDIVLEYVSTGLNPSGQSYVEESIRMAVKEYIFWRKTERDRTASGGEKDRAKYLYDMAFRTANRRNSIDVDTLMAIVRKSYSQTPKS